MDEKILEILKRVFELDSIDENCSQVSCEKWDSLKHLDLVVEIESELNIELEPEEISQMKSFRDIIEIVVTKQSTNNC